MRSQLARQLAALNESAGANVHEGNGQAGCGRYAFEILTSILQQAKHDHKDNSALQALNLQQDYMPSWSEFLAIVKFIQTSLPLTP